MGDLEREVVARLARGAPLDGLGLGRVDGRWDLRGMRFSAARTTPGPRIDGQSTALIAGADELTRVRLEGLDLTGAVWEHLRLTSVQVDDCVLDDARLTDLRMWETRWTDCSLRATHVDGSMGGATPTWRRSRTTTWTRVDFTGADLRGTGHLDETYTDCDFSHARLKEVDFSGARHVRSVFAGLVEDVFFYRRPPGRLPLGPSNAMRDVDLTRAHLSGCSFWDLDLATVRLPSPEQHVLARPKVRTARRALELISADPGRHALTGLQVAMEFWIREGPDTAEAWGVVDRELLGDTPAERAQATAVLEQAIAEVGAENRSDR